MEIRELQEQRAKAVADARAVLDRAEKENRDLGAEERAAYERALAAAGALKDRIERRRRQDDLERDMAALEPPPTARGGERRSREELVRDGFRAWIVSGREARDDEAAREFRGQTAGSAAEGGFLTVPERFVTSLIQGLDDAVVMRAWATIYQVNGADSLGVPTLDRDPDDPDWTTELRTGSEDEGIRFGKRSLHPHPLAKRVRMSNEILRRAVLPVETILRQRLEYKVAAAQERAFLAGSGAHQPLGVFAVSDDGIPAARDVAQGNKATEITFDGLIGAKFSLKGGHRRAARWIFHRDALEKLAKIKDKDGRYIWSGSVREGEPDRLLGLPFFESEFAPRKFVSGETVGILGDFRHYWVADDMRLQVKRLEELYAETNQVGLILRAATDGMPVLAEAFARVKLA